MRGADHRVELYRPRKPHHEERTVRARPQWPNHRSQYRQEVQAGMAGYLLLGSVRSMPSLCGDRPDQAYHGRAGRVRDRSANHLRCWRAESTQETILQRASSAKISNPPIIPALIAAQTAGPLSGNEASADFRQFLMRGAHNPLKLAQGRNLPRARNSTEDVGIGFTWGGHRRPHPPILLVTAVCRAHSPASKRTRSEPASTVGAGRAK
jgi:hypothetical protein